MFYWLGGVCDAVSDHRFGVNHRGVDSRGDRFRFVVDDHDNFAVFYGAAASGGYFLRDSDGTDGGTCLDLPTSDQLAARVVSVAVLSDWLLVVDSAHTVL